MNRVAFVIAWLVVAWWRILPSVGGGVLGWWLAPYAAAAWMGVLVIEWDYALFVVAALAFVVRDELRNKFASNADKELHERVKALELRWTEAAEMGHIRELNGRIEALEKINEEAEAALDEAIEAELAKKKPARRRGSKGP